MQRLVYDIDFEETGSELASLILESYQIKKIMPEVNKAQRAKTYQYVVFSYLNNHGYLCFDIKQKKDLKKNKNVKEKLARQTQETAPVLDHLGERNGGGGLEEAD